MVTQAKRVMVVGLAALLLAGGGMAAFDGDATALAGAGSKPTGGVDAQGRGGERAGEEIPSEREEGRTAQAGSGAINGGGEF
jgi:hypothetical protein